MVKKGNIVDPAGTSTHTTDSIPAISQNASFRRLDGEACGGCPLSPEGGDTVRPQ
jgi:hypothetical protein